MKKDNFKSDFYIIKVDKDFCEHAGKWAMIDSEAAMGKKVRTRYAKNLAELLPFGSKLKHPIFYQVASSGAGFYVPVNLQNPETKEEITILAMVDSGADVSVFSHEIAEAIGVDWKKGVKAKAFRGEKFTSLYVYKVKVSICIADSRKFYPEEVDIMAEKRSANLVGLSGFFNHHEVIFHPKLGIKYRYLK